MSNVKCFRKYEKFGENFRYFTVEEWHRFLDSIDRYEHKLMMRLLYELGCRVGEFVRIQLKHINFDDSTIFFPATNTKNKRKRTSHIPKGLLNELKSCLKQQGSMTKRDERLKKPEAFPFTSGRHKKRGFTENRVRQIFRRYVIKSGLDREYGIDSIGRKLHKFSVHSLRHTHCMHYIHIYKLPIPIVQKQVGHRTLQATMTYCKPTDEMVGQVYKEARNNKLDVNLRTQDFH